MNDFVGAKVALFFRDKLVVYLRDDKPGLHFAGMWDFPGGGREHNETPKKCATREIEEELGISLSDDQYVWEKPFPSMSDKGKTAYFLVANITEEQYKNIQFGDEGQKWKLMTPTDYANGENTIDRLAERLNDYLKSQ